ncbi:hypothetical protein O181_091981 [Austropuccinia psidii MF-1]|uniref:Ty3 transposon capsid-like protein domain-containing protein n=1 Tax=Austropuccinia psidii MF-1 TaxID=1389203 RepID=A0A9Q3IYG8_9BASI|nr:hypothetical protein [Austropuccinia psidii MF-1]
MMEQMTQFMEQLSQAVAPRDTSKAPAFKTPSVKAPDSFDGTKAFKLRGYIQYFQLIFHNDPEDFFSDRKKVLYSTSFLTGRAGKWIEPYLSNISNEDPSYLLNNWQLFETQFFTLFGDPNEVRKAEQELDNLRMRERGQVPLDVADFRGLMSKIGDWGERAYIHVYKRGLEERLFNQLASHPGNFDSLQEIMEITLKLDTRYCERQKEKGSHQEKKRPISGSNSSKPPQSSSSKRPYHRKNKKGKNYQVFKEETHAAFLTKDEVFKETKDVGEDVVISSLHLFQGDIELPPSSFHSSLEGQWDGEEEPKEIETVLRVVPPAYHQYLDVFSEVEVEKLPPHHTCDHHIELEGSLPPVGVIYSLTQHESETL